MRIHGLAAASVVLIAASAASAQDARPTFFFEGDLVRGAGPGATGPTCVLANQFKRKEAVVWRVRVLDPATGKPVDDKGVASLVAELPDGQKIALKYGGHPRGGTEDAFWAGAWVVPENHPTGAFAYKIVATGTDGKAVSWQPFTIKSSQLTIVAN